MLRHNTGYVEKQKNYWYPIIILLCFLSLLILSCASNGSTKKPSSTPNAYQDAELDNNIRVVSDYLNKTLTTGSKLLILNISSSYPELSSYIIDGLIENIVNDHIFGVVDRKQLNDIQKEMKFQLSGAVDDDTAQAVGHKVGAQIIVSGTVAKIGDFFRLSIHAIGIESSEIIAQINRNIPSGPMLTALTKGQASGSISAPAYSQGQSVSKAEQMPALTGEVTNGKYTGTTWSDGLSPVNMIIFGNNTLKLVGTYWGRNAGKILSSNIYSNLVQVCTGENKGFELIEYAGGRLIVQGRKPHFFSKLPEQ
jgi:TolB-like protein